jgi:integrase
MASRGSVKRRTRESDQGVWRNYIEPRFGNRPGASITPAEVSAWAGQLVTDGRASATAARALATLRSILAFAVADSRLTINAAAAVKAPRGGAQGREGQALTYDELHDLYRLCAGLPSDTRSETQVTAAELVLVLGLTGRVGESSPAFKSVISSRCPVVGFGCSGPSSRATAVASSRSSPRAWCVGAAA